MIRGPKPGAGRPAHMASDAEKLAKRFGGTTIPDWLSALATYCDRVGRKRAAADLGYSEATISQTLSGKYGGDIDRIKEVVRGKLLGSTVVCPVLGEIGRDHCLSEQRKKYAGTSSVRTRLFHACPNCINRKGGDHAE